MDLKIKALSPKIGTEIPLPYYATPGAAAMDLHACLEEPVVIPAGERRVIPTGLAIALPPPTAWGSSTATTWGRFWWAFRIPAGRTSPSGPETGSPS